jgi:hypothetical protein
LGADLEYICGELLGIPKEALTDWTAAEIFD